MPKITKEQQIILQNNSDLVSMSIELSLLYQIDNSGESSLNIKEGTKSWYIEKNCNEFGKYYYMTYSNYSYLGTIGINPSKKRLFKKYHKSRSCCVYDEPFYTDDPHAIRVCDNVYANFST